MVEPRRRSSRVAATAEVTTASPGERSKAKEPTKKRGGAAAKTKDPPTKKQKVDAAVLESHAAPPNASHGAQKSNAKAQVAPTRRSGRTSAAVVDTIVLASEDEDMEDGDDNDRDIVPASTDEDTSTNVQTTRLPPPRRGRSKADATLSEIVPASDEEVVVVLSTRAARKPRGKSPAVKISAVKQDEEIVADSQDAMKPKRTARRNQKANKAVSHDPEEVKDDVKEEARSVNKARQAAASKQPKGKSTKVEADVKEEFVDDSQDEETKPKRRVTAKSKAKDRVKEEGKPAKTRGKPKVVIKADESDDDFVKEEVKKAPPPTKAKAKANKGKAPMKKAPTRATTKKMDDEDDESSDFVASDNDDESSDDADWSVAALKAKAARGKDLIDESSDDEADDDKPLKKSPAKRQKTTASTPRNKTPKAEKKGPNGEDETDEDQDPREYPYYEVTYASSGRARCKTCEKTLSKGEMVVAITLVHSRFGMNTYYKHLECTLLNNDVPKELHGLHALDSDDIETVQSYLIDNSKNGVEDERVALADEHFIKRDILPAAKPSPYLTAQLLPYQQEGLAWMKAQEASRYKGGILADEMGMGKTIQAISLMLENVKVKRSTGMLMGGGTLIICPVIACMQWKSEIERFVSANHLSILVYHGPKRTNLSTHLASYDVVLTTYSILENEGRKLMEAEKVACAYCKKLFMPEKLVPHNKYFCGPDARKTAKQAKQKKGKTLEKQKAKKLSDESASSSDDEDHEPIVKKVSVPIPKKRPVKKNARSPLHEVEWTRVILDEAHYIKDKKCSTARSVFRLKTLYKWCLSGTPLQNRIGELFSLVRFLQVDPFAYYECAECDCKQLDFSFHQGRCEHCDHTAMQHYSSFNKRIVNPIQGFGYVAEGKLAMLRLQNDLLRHVLLRRTKESRADDISLPPKLVRVRRDALDEREKDFYESIYTQSKAQFNTYVSAGTLLNNYAHIFDLLIRLRQAVDHPYLVIYSNSNPALQVPTPDVPATEDLPLIEPAPVTKTDKIDEDVCGFCHEPLEGAVQSTCLHQYCRSCVEEYIGSLLMGAQAVCPTCNEPLTVDMSEDPPEVEEKDVAPAAPTRAVGKTSLLRKLPHLADFQSSTKIEALMEELHIMQQHDPSAKAIVFSQFVNMLDLIEHRLLLANVKCVKLSGQMPMAHRDRLLTQFREDATLTVFLISLKAGGVALNLTVASHIFLMDPWWNPAAEHQAIDRTHRLGQFKPIRATRFVIANTIEERILKLQEKKQLVFEGTVGSSTAALARLTIEDLRFLFSG
ncbi:Aste57867_5835 [Aphanomyces stellatus]|uniref:Aste57867_5835 protein n=1 Tax=Aphanomyces stellatus TaxID=120398 RepID=A0A485KFX2_9STRA|nr:hypothetical protein As57867_005821 [Aphanomyces stellatus]VFT82858.1 Aste57867_5835 [Aphanomyces stellatus]